MKLLILGWWVSFLLKGVGADSCGRPKFIAELTPDQIKDCKFCLDEPGHLWLVKGSGWECIPCHKYPHEGDFAGLHFVVHSQYCGCSFLMARYTADIIGCKKALLPVHLLYASNRDPCLDPEEFLASWQPEDDATTSTQLSPINRMEMTPGPKTESGSNAESSIETQEIMKTRPTVTSDDQTTFFPDELPSSPGFSDDDPQEIPYSFAPSTPRSTPFHSGEEIEPTENSQVGPPLITISQLDGSKDNEFWVGFLVGLGMGVMVGVISFLFLRLKCKGLMMLVQV